MCVRYRLVAILALVAPGCSSQVKPPASVPVIGSVSQKGRPAAGIVVKFHPQFDIGRLKYIPSGETGPNGQFILSTGAAGNGAPRGDYIVTLEKPKVVSDREHSGIEMEIDEFKGKYSDPTKSQWKVTVKSGDNVLEPFDID